MVNIEIDKLRFDVLMLKPKHTIRSELGITHFQLIKVLVDNQIKYSCNKSRNYIIQELNLGIHYNYIPMPNELIIKLILGYNGKVDDLPQLERVKYLFILGYNHHEISNILQLNIRKVKSIINKYVLWQR